MAAEREVRVKLSVEGAQEYVDAMERATGATRRFDEARRGVTVELVSVRHGEHHGLPDSESTVDQWEVDRLPTTDFAAKALREAQQRYVSDHPNAQMSDLVWHLRKRESNG